jgi:hypothetical protein
MQVAGPFSFVRDLGFQAILKLLKKGLDIMFENIIYWGWTS